MPIPRSSRPARPSLRPEVQGRASRSAKVAELADHPVAPLIAPLIAQRKPFLSLP
jgi:hypothetical protein